MNRQIIRWQGDINGALVVTIPAEGKLRNVSDLANYIRQNYMAYTSSPGVLNMFGSIALFVAVRDYGKGGPGQVLQRAERAIDSFYLVTPDQEVNKQIDIGIKRLRDYLQGVRHAVYEVIRQESWDFISNEIQAKQDFT